MERTKNPPKSAATEVHPEIGHQRQQGAKLSYRPRHRPQPAEKRVGYERQPQTPSKGRGGNTEPPTRDSEEPWRELRKTEGEGHSEDHLATHPAGKSAQIPADRGGKASQEGTSGPDPNGETKPSFRSRTNKPRPRRGDPIAKVGNPRREQKALEPVYPESDGGRRASRKHKKLQAQQQVCAQP